DRRHDDRDGGDDRVGHLHHLGRQRPARRGARLAAGRLGALGPDDRHRRPLLRRACRDDAPGRRAIRLPPRDVRPDRRVPLLLGGALSAAVQPGTLAAVSVAFARFLGVFVPGVSDKNSLIEPVALGGYALSLSTQQLVALALIATLTVTNTRGLRTGTLIQNTF